MSSASPALPGIYTPEQLGVHVLVHTPGRGRCLTAGRSLKAGEIVFSSSPIAFLVQGSQGSERCSHCFRRSADLKKCARCQCVYYCGKECQTAAWLTFHKKECALQSVLAQVPPLLADALGLAVRTIIATHMHPEHLSLVRDMSCDSDPTRLEAHRQGASLLFQLLGPLCGSEWTEDAIARLLVQGECNNFSIFDDLLVPQGSGVFPLGALLNHSCVGNCIMQYDPATHVQTVRCIRDTSKGEELCHSYVDQAHPTPVRAIFLAEHYGFRCRCPRCEGVEPHALVERCLQGVRAETLHEGTAVEGMLPAAMQDPESFSCELMPAVALKADVDEETNKQLHAAAGAHEHGSTLAPTEGLPLLMSALATRLRLLHPCHLDVLASVCALQNVCAEVGSWSQALTFGRHVVSMYKILYPAHHPMIGLQWYRLGDVAQQLDDSSRSRAFHRLAVDNLTMCYGPDSALVSALAAPKSS